MTIAFRPASFLDAADAMFIISNWSSSMKKSHNAGLLWHEDYAEIMHAQIRRCFFDRAGSRALIAYDCHASGNMPEGGGSRRRARA